MQKIVSECDVCGLVAKDNDVSTWRQVSITSLAAPPEPVPGTITVAGMPVQTSALLCHKPSCLTTWAKDQNAKAKA